MYTTHDYPSAKAIREAFASGEVIRVYQPGPFGPDVRDGFGVIEGPHYPKPHRFYLRVEVRGGRIVSIPKR